MPLPLLPFIIGGIGAAFGAASGINAAVNNSKAKDINERANRIFDKAKAELEKSRASSNKALEDLGRTKLTVLDTSVKRFIGSFEKLHNVDFQESSGLNELGKFRLDKESLRELRDMGNLALSVLGATAGGSAAGAAGGALVAFGAFSGVAALGTASTGTAIAALSGAAATNATLAVLGGGTLAAGGAGIAGGALVLGGLVAGPALAIMGIMADANACKNYDKAWDNMEEAKKRSEEIKTVTVLCDGIAARSNMFETLLDKLDTLFVPLVNQMEVIIDRYGEDYRIFPEDDKKSVSAAASIAGAIKTVIDTPILTQEGALTDESQRVADEIEVTFLNGGAGKTTEAACTGCFFYQHKSCTIKSCVPTQRCSMYR